MWRQKFGIDLGTANTLIFAAGKGIVVQEPSVVAVDDRDNVLAVGLAAYEMVGRTPGNVHTYFPLRDGVIASFETTRLMLTSFLRRVSRRYVPRAKPYLLIGVPSGATQVEQRAIMEAGQAAGAEKTFIIEEPVAAAIGAGLPFGSPRGTMVVDIGGGTTDVAILSCGGVVTGRMIRVAGMALDDAIARDLKTRLNLMIGQRTAEEVKIRVGSGAERFTVAGRDQATGLPRSLEVTAAEVHEALRRALWEIVAAVRATLEECPPELLSDIMADGMVLVGGGALLRGLDRLIERETGIPARVAPNALTATAEGAGMALGHLEVYRKTQAVRQLA